MPGMRQPHAEDFELLPSDLAVHEQTDLPVSGILQQEEEMK